MRVRVTFEHRHENKSCSACLERVYEKMNVLKVFLVPSFCLTFRHFLKVFCGYFYFVKISRTGFGEGPHVLMNGVPLDKKHLNGEDFEEGLRIS